MSLEIIKGIENVYDSADGVVATIGTYDGLHLGHQAILKRLMSCSEKRNLTAVAITFEPHPRVLVTPDSPPPLLTTWDEKVNLFENYMSGRLIVLEFNSELMNMSAEIFAQSVLIEKLHVKKLIVGYDHAFGKNRSGTINDLMELSRRFDFELEVVNPVIIEGHPISSSRIRRMIAARKFSQALEILGHPYPIQGTVKKGILLGRKLGYPTANISYSERKLLPIDGVYSCRVKVSADMYDGMMFVGTNHFNPEGSKSVEVNIFDFDREIYDEEIVCYPEVFIRENRKFDNTGELSKRIDKDKEEVLRLKNKGE